MPFHPRQTPFIPFLLLALALASARADDVAREGTIVLSNGEELHGPIRLTDGKPLEIFDVAQKTRYKLILPEIAGITVEVESEHMQDGWTFLEEGSDKKVKLPFQYPLRKYRTIVRLAAGQELRGHAVAVVYVTVGADERRVMLLADQKGEKGQTLADLVYVREIRFAGVNAGTANPESLTTLVLTLTGAQEVTVVDADRDKGFPARAPGKDGAFRCAGLLPGAYDVFARTDAALCGFLTAPGELSEADRDDLRARIAEIEEFYDEKRILATAGSKDRAKVLIEMRRTQPTTLKEEGPEKSRFIRWEVWTLHRLERTWQVDARIFLFRARVPPGADFPAVEFRPTASLGGVKIAGTRAEETLQVDLGRR